MVLLQVNNKDVSQATHQDAVMALIAPTYEIILEIRHDPQPPGLKVCVLPLCCNGYCRPSVLVVHSCCNKNIGRIKGLCIQVIIYTHYICLGIFLLYQESTLGQYLDKYWGDTAFKF